MSQSNSIELPAEDLLGTFAQLLERPVTPEWPVQGTVLRLFETMASESADALYHTFSIPKGRGRTREIQAPMEALKFVQAELGKQLLSRASVMPGVCGFVRGLEGGAYAALEQSLQSIAAQGGGDGDLGAVYATDINEYFPSINRDQVRDVVWHLLFRVLHREPRKPLNKHRKKRHSPQLDIETINDLAELITDLCCLNGSLPQGSPASPPISNMIGSKFDRAILRNLAPGQAYLRYADDITVMSVDGIDPELRGLIRSILESCGFTVSRQKDEYREGQKRYRVLGVEVYPAKHNKGGLRFKLPSKDADKWAEELRALCDANDLPENWDTLSMDPRFTRMLGQLGHAYTVTKYGRDKTAPVKDPHACILPRPLRRAWESFKRAHRHRLHPNCESWFRSYTLETTRITTHTPATPEIFDGRIDRLARRREEDPGEFRAFIANARKALEEAIADWEKAEEKFGTEDCELGIEIEEFGQELGGMASLERAQTVRLQLARVIAFQQLYYEGRFNDRGEGKELEKSTSEQTSILPRWLAESWEKFREAIVATGDTKLARGMKFLFWDKERVDEFQPVFVEKKKRRPERSRFMYFPGFTR